MHEKECAQWLSEAQDRYQSAHHLHKTMEPYENETKDEFHARRERVAFRVEHRRDVKDHLAKKCQAIKDRKANGQHGTISFDGVDVAAWIIPWLKKSRENGWTGAVVSGYRSPEEQCQACIGVCGNCEGCAGTCAKPGTSNHQLIEYPGGAVDVTDYSNFERVQYAIGSPLRNDLPIDPVHFSVSGH